MTYWSRASRPARGRRRWRRKHLHFISVERDGQALSGGAEPDGALQQLPAIVREPFSSAMADTLLLPVGVLMLGFVSVLFFQLPRHLMARKEQAAQPEPAALRPSSRV